MCSKCYRDVQQQNEKAAASMARQKPALEAEPAASRPEPAVAPVSAAPEPSASTFAAAPAVTAAAASDAPEEGAGPAKKQPSRCQHPDCKKKLGLTGFTCKCEMMFCPSHRLAESHSCSFDYKGTQRARLAENNPLVQAAKIHKI